MHAPSVLHKVLVRACPWMHAARRQALVVSVAAAITSARLTVTALGRAMDSSASVKHCIKRADRLLSNPHLQHERRGVYLALAHALVGGTAGGDRGLVARR